jgi:predicted transposase YbfD/YdcC
MVSAWADKNHLVLGQTKVEEKSNEITAIPKLLDLLALKGCIVTMILKLTAFLCFQLRKVV